MGEDDDMQAENNVNESNVTVTVTAAEVFCDKLQQGWENLFDSWVTKGS